MVDKKSETKGKKLTVKKSALKDLKVGTKAADIKGGGKPYQATKSPSDGPGCC